MRIGVPRERLVGEGRVGLLPSAVRMLVSAGHTVVVEQDAGARSGASDADYRLAGAEIANGYQVVYESADLIVKVKEPKGEEVDCLQRGQILFCFLHMAAHPKLNQALSDRGCIAIAYEGIQEPGGEFPLLAPMSRIAGQLSVHLGSVYLLQQYGGKGLLLGGGLGRVTVLGCGVAGKAAIRAALRFGAHVTALDIKPSVLDELFEEFDGRIVTQLSTEDVIHEVVAHSDLLIGAVLIPGIKAPQVVRREHVRQMEAGSVIVDIAIDQGGCVETSRPTSYEQPTFVEEGVVHCCVRNLPSAVAKTASDALCEASLPYVERIARLGSRMVLSDPALKSAVCVAGVQVQALS